MKITVTACVLVGALNVSCVASPSMRTIDSDIQQAIVAMVTTAERARLRTQAHLTLTDSDQWIKVVVDREDVEIDGATFYRARNDQVDPPVTYFVGRTAAGTLFRLGGFDDRETQFDMLTTELITQSVTVPESDAIALVDAYFEFVERWTPGIPERKGVSLPLRWNAADCAMGRSAAVINTGDSQRVTAVIADSGSGRVECVEVMISHMRGFEVLRRTVLAEGQRIEL